LEEEGCPVNRCCRWLPSGYTNLDIAVAIKNQFVQAEAFFRQAT
jgi:hypothetical protein